MTSYYATPVPNSPRSYCGLLRIEGVHTPEPQWIALTEQEYLTFSASTRGLRLVNGVVEELPPKPVRRIPLREFLRRWTLDEKVAIEEASEAPTRDGRQLRIGWREIVAGSDVHLDHPDLVSGLTDLSTVLVTRGIWSAAAAAQRLSEIRA